MEYTNEPSDYLGEYCKKHFGIEYLFPWQRLIVSSVLERLPAKADIVAKSDNLEDDKVSPLFFQEEEKPEPLRQIAVLPTGAGKSLCWMLPARLMRGLTVAVFPLLSLMDDQKRRLEECGIPSVTLRGGMEQKEKALLWKRLESGEARIVLANPEILLVRNVQEKLGALGPDFLVIDETHTVSQWGESFRPACASMGELVEKWQPAAVLALTATAGPHIRNRIRELLFNGDAPSMALGKPDRPEIRYGVLPTLSRSHYLTQLVRLEERPLMVFGPTRRFVEHAARMLRLRLNDKRICYYHAGLSREEKSRLENWFFHSQDGILCATCAYGMGVDKKNIRSVIHLAPPGSPEAYLQEAGRSSRDGMGARAWLICTPQDNYEKLELDNDKAIQHNSRNLMREYAMSTKKCRREMLLSALGVEAEDCSGCDVCGGHAWKEPPEESVILNTVRRGRKHLGKGLLARFLTGRRTVKVCRSNMDGLQGFGVLDGWELEDVEEALETLLRCGKLRWGSLGAGRKKLYIGKARLPSLFNNFYKKIREWRVNSPLS